MNKPKKLLFAAALVLVTTITSQAQNVGINSTGNLPNSSAMLDISAANKGLLIPNVALTGTTNASPITSPAVSLLVYNTATTGDVSPGYYYNSGTSVSPVWTKLSNTPGTNLGDMQYWNGTAWVVVPVGQPGQFLQLMATSIPTWSGAAFPTLTTTVATSITETTATSGGNITSDGGATVTARGVCWGASSNPTTANSKTSDGAGVGSFTSSLTSLTENTTYYVRVYATNSSGTAYGNENTFKTLGPATVIDIDGNVYNTVKIGTQTWMLENLKTTKYRNGDLISNVTDDYDWLTLNTDAYCWLNNDPSNKAIYGGLYNWFAVADSRNIAPVGWHVPTDAEWTTLTDYLGGTSVAGGKLKEVGTSHWLAPNVDATNSSGFTALPFSGRAYYDGAFGDVGRVGAWWSSTASDAMNAWSRPLDYNSAGTSRWKIVKQSGFSVRCVKDSPVVLPTLYTTDASSVATTTAISGGNIISDGISVVTARGVCWGTAINPTTANSTTSDGTGIGTFTSSLFGLTENTTYYLRAYATNNSGTCYGNEITFKTLARINFNPDLTYGTMTDIDGNEYKTITIGTQTWMAENLKTTKYRNGDPISNVTDIAAWTALATGTGAYCWYNNDQVNIPIYGGLYNWYAVADSRNIAPVGWHVPTDAEWTTLIDYLGGTSVAGECLKETGTSHWERANTGATNSSGFAALPGGYRNRQGYFSAIGSLSYWWSSSEYSTTDACLRYMNGNSSGVTGSNVSDSKVFGFSVRCLRD